MLTGEQASLVYAQGRGLDEVVVSGTQAAALSGLGHPLHLRAGAVLKEAAQVLVAAQGPLHVLWGDAYLVVVASLLARQLEDVGRQVLENAREEDRCR